MTALVWLIGEDAPSPLGESYRVERESDRELKNRSPRRVLPARLAPGALEEQLDDMRRRGVVVAWDEEAFVLFWPAVEAWPWRDPSAWRDIHHVRINFAALLERFGLRAPRGGFRLDLPALSLPLVFCDVETTGGSTDKHRICEIAICRVEPGLEPEWFADLVHPGQPITNSWIHGIRDSDVEGKPAFGDIAERVAELLEGAVFTSHQTNAIDERFCKAELAAAGITWEPPAKLNTCTMAKRLYPELGSHKLQDLVQVLGIRSRRAHRAKDDVEAMMSLFYKHLLARAAARPTPPVTLGEYQRL